MAWSLVQSLAIGTVNNTSNGVPSVSAAFGSNVVANNAIVVHTVSWQNPSSTTLSDVTVTDSQSNTYTNYAQAESTGDAQHGIFVSIWRAVASSSGSLTVTVTGHSQDGGGSNSIAASAAEVSGLSTAAGAGGLDVSATGTGHTGGSGTTASGTTAAAAASGELVVSVVGDWGGSHTWTSSNYTAESGLSFNPNATDSLAVVFGTSTVAAQSTTWTSSPDDGRYDDACIAVLKLSAAASIPWAPPAPYPPTPPQYHRWVPGPLKSPPALLGTALMESPVLRLGYDTWQRPPYWTRPGPLESDPRLLTTALTEKPVLKPIFDVWQRPVWSTNLFFDEQPILSPSALLATALTEQPVLRPIYDRWDRPPYWVRPGEVLSSPPLLTTANLEAPLLKLIFDTWLRPLWASDLFQQFEPLESNPSLLATALTEQPTLRPILDSWLRPPYWVPPGPLQQNQSSAAGIVNFDPTTVQKYDQWRRDPYWTRPGPLESPAGLLATALLEVPPPVREWWYRGPWWLLYFDFDELKTDPSVIASALLEIPPPRSDVWTRPPYWVRPSELGVDPNLLAAALLEIPPPRSDSWTRPPYWTPPGPQQQNQATSATNFDPTLAGINWQRFDAVFNARPDSIAYWQRILPQVYFYTQVIANTTTLPGIVTPTALRGLVTPSSLAGKASPSEQAGKS